MHILSPETDNCPSWISRRERMTVENISWSISAKECCRPQRGLNPQPPGLQLDGASNWPTEAGPICCTHAFISNWQLLFLSPWNGKNDRRNDFMINLHKSYVVKLGFELVTPGSAVRCLPNCAMSLTNYYFSYNYYKIHQLQILFNVLLHKKQCRTLLTAVH